MDGAIIVDKDVTRILRAAVHLMPDHTIPSEETGTRHRTADRVARQTGFPVISVSQSMQIIAAYVGETRHVLEDSGQILSRANQALATLERYKLRLDEVSSTLSALEIEDLVTVRDVAVVAQRLEMVTRIAREIEDYVLELGTDGRLLSLQLEELITGVDIERELVIRDYLPVGRRSRTPESRARPARVALLDRAGRPRRRRPGARASAPASTSTAPSPRAATGCSPRSRGCPAPSSTGWSSTSAPCRSCSPPASTTSRPSTASASCAPAASARASPASPSRRSSSATSSRRRRSASLDGSSLGLACPASPVALPLGVLASGAASASAVTVTVAAVGVVSSNCRSDGSPPSAAALTWYQPGSAQSVRGEQSASERLAVPDDGDVVATALRTTTSRSGSPPGTRLVQIASLPEVI